MAGSYPHGQHKSLELSSSEKVLLGSTGLKCRDCISSWYMLSFECVPYAPQIEHFQSRPCCLSPKLPFIFTSSVPPSLQAPNQGSQSQLSAFSSLSSVVSLACFFSVSLLSLPLQVLLFSEVQPLLPITWTVASQLKSLL